MHMKNFFVVFLVWMVFGWMNVCCAQATENGADVREVISGLSREMKDIETVQSDFVQEKKLQIFDQKIVMEGRMFLQKPDRFSWHVRKPLRYAMIMDNRVMRQWDEESGSVQPLVFERNPALAAAVQQIQQWFSGAYEVLGGEYDIALVSREPIVLSFFPKTGTASSAVIERVAVAFRPDKRYIERIEIYERGGDSTVLSFTNTSVNTAIPASAWRLVSQF
jgi:outer membrane lipoprotein-sorting protein